jgi:hypothetical protein
MTSKTDILARTEKGEQEIKTQANKLPIKHRSVLIMVDGKHSEEVLQAKLSGMFDGKTIVSDLETHGFITRQAAPQAVPAASAKNSQPAGPKESFLEGIVHKVKDMSEEFEAKSK